VTGAHAFKVGVEVGSGETPRPFWTTGDLRMTFNNGSPQSVTLVLPRDAKGDGYFPDFGLYVQERWSLKRATFTGGLRYDYYEGHVGAGCLPPSRRSASTASS
jgi:outer membrane receptor protein involved in Fe transport